MNTGTVITAGPLFQATLLAPSGLEAALSADPVASMAEAGTENFLEGMDHFAMALNYTGLVNVAPLLSGLARFRYAVGRDVAKALVVAKHAVAQELGRMDRNPFEQAADLMVTSGLICLPPKLQERGQVTSPPLKEMASQWTNDPISANILWNFSRLSGYSPYIRNFFAQQGASLGKKDIDDLLFLKEIFINDAEYRQPDRSGWGLEDMAKNIQVDPSFMERLWPLLYQILTCDQRAFVRFNVLTLLYRLLYFCRQDRYGFDPKINNFRLVPEDYGPFIAEGLKDSAILIVKFSTQFLFDLIGKRAALDMMADYPSARVRHNRKFGIKKYVSHLKMQTFLFHEFINTSSLFDEILNRESKTHVPLEHLHPLHSLADFNPSNWNRKDIVAKKYRELERIIGEVGFNKEAVLENFYKVTDVKNDRGMIHVMRFSGGKDYVFQGHHRVATLFLAASRGLIPKEWLDSLPAIMLSFEDHEAGALVQRLVTGGVELTWSDLFPEGWLAPA